MQDRLAGWKKNSLCMARHIVITKLVIKAFLIYIIHVVAIPSTTLDEIEKFQRAFIWVLEPLDRKIHTISWNKIYAFKDVSGLGFRNLKHMNKAYLMKLIWRIVTNEEDLWNHVLEHKYKCNSDWTLHTIFKHSDSYL